ncbi:MAG TPA: cellulase family glycosylhydrolase [Candidatus Paceibacterota bacterium]
MRSLIITSGILVILTISYFFFAFQPSDQLQDKITYGVSFNTQYARELGLDWREVYNALLTDLNVKHVRLAAHWPMIEPEKDLYNWDELDYQIHMAQNHNADVILAVGRRLPRWPECHIPQWAQNLSWDDQKEEIKDQITHVVERYKNESNIIYWQVENEPFLTVFATEHCGELDKSFLKEEIALVRELDPTRPIVVTDSGNLGLWYNAYRLSDVFGTSVYLFLWNPDIGPFKSILPASYYRVKQNIMRFLFGKKPMLLIELSAEPWLLTPVIEASIETQYQRMSIDKFEQILNFAKETGFNRQYLWGAEWWYWLKKRGDNSFWEHGKELFL